MNIENANGKNYMRQRTELETTDTLQLQKSAVTLSMQDSVQNRTFYILQNKSGKNVNQEMQQKPGRCVHMMKNKNENKSPKLIFLDITLMARCLKGYTPT